MWNDRPAKSQIVGELDKLEEMDVALSVRELRDVMSHAGELHVAKLLSGHYVLEPWVRMRLDSDGEWNVAYGIEVTRDEEDGA